MIRFSQGVFVRRAGGQSILWSPQTGTCLILDGAEPFLRHIGRGRKKISKNFVRFWNRRRVWSRRHESPSTKGPHMKTAKRKIRPGPPDRRAAEIGY